MALIWFLHLLVLWSHLASPSAAPSCQKNVLPMNTMASIHYTVSTKPIDLKCSAIILNDFWLLSPASCLFDHSNPSRYKIFLQDAKTAMVVNKIIRNPSFNNELGAGYDLALINVPIKMSPPCPVNLPLEDAYDMNTCYLVKTNKDNKFGQYPITMQIQANACKLAKHVTNGESGARLVECAKGEGVCRDEAGAVILCVSASDETQFYLRDISSWGDTFCKEDKEYLFTKISPYTHWINSTISSESEIK